MQQKQRLDRNRPVRDPRGMSDLKIWVVASCALALVACGDDSNSPDGGTPDGGTDGAMQDGGTDGAMQDGGTDGAGPDGGAAIVYETSLQFEPIAVEPGEESLGQCQSITLNNDEPLYVRAIRQTNAGAWHHSNWFFVPEDAYGEANTDDGTWRCRDRDWSEVGAAVQGGVFFAQSTQALTEEQIFPEGAVLEIPPRHKIAGDIHLVNIQAGALNSAITIDVATVPEEEAEVKLSPVSFSYGALEIPPADPLEGPSTSRFSMTCDMERLFQTKFGTEADYSIYYVLGHYHGLGNYFQLDFVDIEESPSGPPTETVNTVMQISTLAGEPLGQTISPIAHSGGANHLRVTCGYRNTTDREWNYGFADGEMCVFLAYIDADIKIAGNTDRDTNVVTGTMPDGTVLNEAPCDTIGF